MLNPATLPETPPSTLQLRPRLLMLPLLFPLALLLHHPSSPHLPRPSLLPLVPTLLLEVAIAEAAATVGHMAMVLLH